MDGVATVMMGVGRLFAAASRLLLTADAEGAEPPIRYNWTHAKSGALSNRMTIEVARMRLELLSEYDCEINSAVGQHAEATLFARPVKVGRGSVVLSPRASAPVNHVGDDDVDEEAGAAVDHADDDLDHDAVATDNDVQIHVSLDFGGDDHTGQRRTGAVKHEGWHAVAVLLCVAVSCCGATLCY